MKKQMTFSASKVNTGMRNLASQPTGPFDVSRPSRRAFVAGSASFIGLAAASPMAFAAEQQALPAGLWLISAAIVLWTVAFDTYYAMVDRQDDLKIGIKSTAILFGRQDLLIIAILQLLALVLLAVAGE